jgi:outer membrane lipoprotein carrier protein
MCPRPGPLAASALMVLLHSCSARVGAWMCATAMLTAATAQALDTNAVLNAWFAAQTNLQSWTAEFTETRTFKALAQPLQTPGRAWVAMPDRFRWELGNPAQTIVVRQGNELVIVYPRLKRAERYPLDSRQAGPWKDAMALMQAGMPRSRAELESNFKLVSLAQTNAAWLLSLQPRSSFARRMMPEVRVELATDGFSLQANQVTFTDGSTMRDEFRNAQVNQPLEASLFTPPVGPEFKVVSPHTQ